MNIEINTDHNKDSNIAFVAKLKALLVKILENYSSEITLLEVHLTDENGKKEGIEDKKCLLEAHVEKMNPIVSRYYAKTYEQSLIGSIEKLKASLDTKIGKLHNRHHS
jgi:hypothetical protein